MSNNPTPSAPLAKDGDIAVFPHMYRPFVTVNNVEVPIYNVAVGKPGKRNYVEVYGNVAGRQLEPEMVLELMKGEEIILDFPSKHGGTYVASLVNGGLKIETFKNRTTHKLNMVKIGHIVTKEGEHCGYRVPGPDGRQIEFYKHIRSSKFPKGPSIELDARDCYALATGEQVQAEIGTVKMTGTSEKQLDVTTNGKTETRTFTRATLAMRYRRDIETSLREGSGEQSNEREGYRREMDQRTRIDQNASIAELKLPDVAVHILEALNITTVQALTNTTAGQLLSFPEMDASLLQQIDGALKAQGLSLARNAQPPPHVEHK